MPFCISKDGSIVDLHLIRSNPIANSNSNAQPAVIITSGSDSYVSPDWYKSDHQVPTWNYIAVHLHGTLERLAQDELRASLDALSDHYEAKLAPKPVWKTDKLPKDVLDRMMRMIVPYRFRITRTEGTWKLGQNKTEPDRLSAGEMVREQGIGQEVEDLANLMLHPKGPE